MAEILRREVIYLWYYLSVLFEQIFPYWLFGVISGSFVSEILKNHIFKLFESLKSTKLQIIGLIPASLLGIASPLCMYGTVPLAASFAQKAMREDWLAAFMMSSILLNPQLIAYSSVLGNRVVILRVVLALICGILAGLLVGFYNKKTKKSFFNFLNFNYHSKSGNKLEQNVFLRLLRSLFRNIRITGPYFILGIVLTACFQRYIPKESFLFIFSQNKAFGILMAASLGVPLYACGGGTIPLLFDWLSKGMTLGAASAFMISGPATKLTNLGALKIILGMKKFILYILFSLAFAFFSGLIIDLIL